MELNPDACKRLIYAILEQALTDAQSPAREHEPQIAQRFINPENKLFVHYCDLLDINAEYMAKHMQIKIKKTLQAKKDKRDRMLNAMYQL
jgi:hypothetical protein